MKQPDYLISTPENVDLHLELAGIGNRLWAGYIDIVILYLINLAIVVVTVLLGIVLEKANLPKDLQLTISYWLAFIVIFLIGLVTAGYFIYFEGTWKGQTPGKKFVHIRVVETNGQPLNWSAVFIRNLLRIADMFCLIGVLFILFQNNERRIGDLAANTLVIRERQTDLSARNLQINCSQPPASFMDSGCMSPDDYHLLTIFLKRRHSLSPESRMRLAKETCDFFRMKLNPEFQGESSEELLEKIYLAYTAQSVS